MQRLNWRNGYTMTIKKLAWENSWHFATQALVSPRKSRNSILMTCHYPDLGSDSDWLCRYGNLLQPIRCSNKILAVTRQRYWIFCACYPEVISRETGGATRNVGCFLKLSRDLRLVAFFFFVSDQFRFVGNCPPTPPLSHHFALSEK